ncbi:uncharacterized protein LOC126879282 [Diabrotica virgifera virgifera]|uniref:Uncharacterized protein n=1 Tax=Diabrotica virgifera virgifera TaxID=50390 RepID=A0ABM5JK55_DIAVI|nr:uncharacterized protein LOC126879282 [Diabrotica virgifera virgifera]
MLSPINSGESDADLSDFNPTYKVENDIPKRKKKNCYWKILKKYTEIHWSHKKSLIKSCHLLVKNLRREIHHPLNEKVTISRNQRNVLCQPSKWKKICVKKTETRGKTIYRINNNKHLKESRNIKLDIDHATRLKLFQEFLDQGDINLQRIYLTSCTTEVTPKYMYSNTETPRNPNKAYLTVEGIKVRVHKQFFLNTLDIPEKIIRTALAKKTSSGTVTKDMRGRHENHHTINPVLIEDIKRHINSIPRVESHYLRASTSREYIDGSKAMAVLYRDFKQQQETDHKEAGTYHTYYHVFNKEFNISIHTPKKDQCDLCVAYGNADLSSREEMEEKYAKYHEEKLRTN